MEVGGYRGTDIVRESLRSVVWRGLRRSDGRPVVIKTPAPHLAPAQVRARFRNEWLIAQLVDAPELVEVLELVDEPTALALVFADDDPELRALDEHALAQPPDTAACVRVALAVLDALTHLHAKNVVHKDIKPSNVLVSPDYGRAVLIDFGISAVLPRELRRTAGARIEGTLGYMPPEQTGRIDRAVDYRSDYYSLGATLYWLLTGERLFPELREASELIHAQLTRVPPLAHERAPERRLPPVLSRVVAKLLRKSADERYQGSHGLRQDLRRILDALEGPGEVPEFAIASRDPSERLRPPQRLYGRDTQRARLLELHRQARPSAPSLARVRGPSGSGKSALIDDLRSALMEEGASSVFSVRKFDQYSQADPRTGLGRILEGMLVAVRGHPEVPERALAGAMAEAMAANASLLRPLVPSLGPMLDALAPRREAAPASVGPAEQRDRFWDTVEGFVEVLRRAPVAQVLVLDDVQWADATSLRLVELLVRSSPADAHERSTGTLTVVLGCRTDAPGIERPEHPLQSLARAHPKLVDVELGPLSLDELTALVDEVLGGADEGPALAALLHQRTGGTPLYVSQLLMALYAEGIIDTDRSRGRWRVDLDRARARGSSGDVVAFLVEQFQALPADLRRVLGIAACIGERFTIEALAEAADEAPTQVGALIWAAVSAGHLHPLDPDDAGAALPKPREAGSTLVAPRAFGFVHDRLQQVARSSLEGDREALYLGLARRASQRAEPRQSPLDDAERVHTLARYIGHALPRVEDPEEALRFAAWCAEAGRLTRAAAAFERAAEHTGHARTLLARADAPRPERFARTLELAESLAMAGRREAAKACFEDAAALTDAPHQRAQRMLSQVTLAMVVGDTDAALAVVADAAAAFELDLRLGGDEAWMGGLMARVLGAVEAAAAEAPLTELPPLPADDRFHAALGHMLLASTNAAYLSGDINLYAALALTLIDMGLGHGVGEVTGVAFVQLAIIFASALADYEGARRFCTLGFTLLERFPDSPLWGMANIIRGTTIQPWIEHMPTSVPLLEAAHVRLRASGMVLNAGYAYFCVVMNAFSMGAPLASVVEQSERAFAYLEKFGDRPLAAATQAHLDACDRLREHAPRRAANPRADREAAALNPAALFVIHSVSAFTAWVLGEGEEADAALAGVGPALAAGTGLFPWAVFQVVAAARACERLEGAPDLDEPERAALVETVDQTRAMLARWRESCPANADSFAHLLEGAWAGTQGEQNAALRAYTAAADAAAKADFLAIEGLANERAAALLEGRGGTPRAAVGYLVYARAAYRRWGARVLERRVAAKLRALGHAETSTEPKASVTETLYTLDVSSLVRMSMALSESTQVEDLLAQLLALAAENAGADRCAVLLMEAGGLHLHADQRAGEAVHSLAPPVPLSTLDDDLAARMVEACRRSSSPLVVDDTEAPPQLGSPSWRNRDPYLDRAAVRSALALPMTERGVTVGVLYLENRVTPGAFTRQHQRVLGTLAAQAAVSIANARLFTAARGREARWRALATSAPDAIMIVDEQRRIRYANREAFGRTPTELAEVRVDELVSPADREALASAVAFVFSTGSTTACEVGVPTSAGQRSYTTRMGPILGELGVDQVTLIATDVTEQRQLEQQLRQSQKMQAVGTLAGGVAHDFNNLLTVILGACELGELDLEQLPDLPPALAQSLGDAFSEIGGAAQRAAELTRQLLAFSRRQVLAPKHFDLNALASGISRMLTRLLGERVELAIELDPQPCGVHADRGQLEQVIVNLAVNARDAMAEGGTVTLETRRVVIPPGAAQGQRRDAVLGATPPAAAHLATTGELPVGRAVVLEVRDTGAGMDAETLARVFEPFFTTKASGEGTGLGLATVLGIADQSGGAMVVATQLGVGSRFCLVLPVDESHTQTELAPAPTHVPVGGDEHVLIVEDDPGVQRLVALLLGGHGYQVHTASGGEAALALAEELRAQGSQLDLVLTDVVMPGMTGPEVAEAVRTLHPGVATLFMSGYTNDAMVRHGIATGDANFLQKPFTRPSLLQTVRSALDSPRTP